MAYLKLARWPHWFPGLFAVLGIFYAQKLFDSKYLFVTLWFFLPFLLAGIGAEILISAISLKRNLSLLSQTEQELGRQFDWKLLAVFSALLFTIATVLANLYTKGLHSSWFILAMLAFALLYGLLLRSLWLIDLLSFPVLYLLPLVAGTLDTMLPLYATQIILVYFFGISIYALRLCSITEYQYHQVQQRCFELRNGTYQRELMPYLLAFCVVLFACSLIYHLIDQAARMGRISLFILPLLIYLIVKCAYGYYNYLQQTEYLITFRKIFNNRTSWTTALLCAVTWSLAVHWRL